MHDAIVVGARCAGSPTAMLLARAGRRVLLLDRATFPRLFPVTENPSSAKSTDLAGGARSYFGEIRWPVQWPALRVLCHCLGLWDSHQTVVSGRSRKAG